MREFTVEISTMDRNEEEGDLILKVTNEYGQMETVKFEEVQWHHMAWAEFDSVGMKVEGGVKTTTMTREGVLKDIEGELHELGEDVVNRVFQAIWVELLRAMITLTSN